MTNYFRITAYHPEKDICAIFDSNGYFEKLWQFSAFLVQKGFKIIEVGNEEKFLDGDIPKTSPDTEHILLRACGKNKPQYREKIINGIPQKMIIIGGKSYIPKTNE